MATIEMTAKQASTPALRPRLARHRYPFAIVVAAAVTLALAGYSLVRAPALIGAAADLHSGQAALDGGDYAAAASAFRRAYGEAPTSRKIRISLAEADFGAGRPRAALTLLQGVKLSRDEWESLTRVMPAHYQRLFGPAG